jgi:peptidoglycan/xylan/chitin deacetylase (PgdA/CDA1 family)
MKHRLKKILRKCIGIFFHTTGLRGLFRAKRDGVPVLMFHNVGYPPETEYLPDHMKISERKFARLLGLLQRAGYRTRTVSQLVEDLSGESPPGDTVALTFDDGYRDNHDKLLPLLQEHGATATVYVQTGPMKSKLNWLHHYFWVLHEVGPHELAARIAEQLDRPHLQSDLNNLPSGETAAEYEMKRLLKYEITPLDRDRILEQTFCDMGGDDTELAKRVYLGPEECRVLDRAGVEIGAHTVNHLILSSLDDTQQRLEIEGSLRDLESWLGHSVPSFAYPYGRTWDYNEQTLKILADLGFRSAITAMPGLNSSSTPLYELRRIAVNDDSDLGQIMCEVDGVFGWFGRRGLNLSV